jgi:hypothetical protein
MMIKLATNEKETARNSAPAPLLRVRGRRLRILGLCLSGLGFLLRGHATRNQLIAVPLVDLRLPQPFLAIRLTISTSPLKTLPFLHLALPIRPSLTPRRDGCTARRHLLACGLRTMLSG